MPLKYQTAFALPGQIRYRMWLKRYRRPACPVGMYVLEPAARFVVRFLSVRAEVCVVLSRLAGRRLGSVAVKEGNGEAIQGIGIPH